MYVYFGHHKCASSWISPILHYVCQDAGISIADTGRSKVSPRNTQGTALNTHVEFLSIRNTSWDDVAYLSSRFDFRGFHVIRDPRDILVSAYFSHLKSHPTDTWPELIEQRCRLTKLTEEDGLLATKDFLRPLFEDMAGWEFGHQRVLELRFEELTTAPFEHFLTIFQYLGLLKEDRLRRPRRFIEAFASVVNAAASRARLPFVRWRFRNISAELILAHVYDNRFSRLANGRNTGQTDPSSHFRRGVAGDWRNYFTDRVKEAFKREWQGLVEKLGYEKDGDW